MSIRITGAPTTVGSDGSVPLRREIRDLQTNFPDQFNLLLLGLRAFMQQDEEAVTSYYQIAGIHGMPFKPWDNVQGISDWEFGGYCTHSSVLFVPWHRPYCALFEQALYAVVQGIVSQFPTELQAKYAAAAQTFRLPYFDWAMTPPAGSSAFPSSLSGPTVSVVDVDGKTKSIANPFYQFSFHPVNPEQGDFDAQWSRYKNTVRYPTRTGTSQDSRVTQVLTNESSSLRSNVALLLLSYTDFDAFSNNQWRTNQSPGSFGSLEDVHNEIHDKVGGNGHMGALEVAAFDPVFWLHHANVDRLWAIWQDLNPSSELEARPAPQSTFTTEQGTSETSQSALTPFWDASGNQTFWTADGVKDTKTFGYAYPETQSWQYPSNDAYQQALKQTVTQLYGGNVFQNLQQSLAAKAKVQSVASVNAAAEETDAASAPITMTTAKPASHAQLAASHVDKKAKGPIVNVTPISDGHNGDSDSPPAVHDIHVDSNGDGHGQQAQHVIAPHNTIKREPATNKHIPASLAHLAPDNTYKEWIVNIRALKHGLDQTFRVMIFLGPISESDPADWDIDPNLVGRVSVLGQSSVHCAKCRSDAENALVVSGTVVLTSALLEKVLEGGLASLDPTEVVPYLRNHLGWRVRVFSGEETDAGHVPGLEVSVCSTRVRIGDDGMPIYSGEYETHPEVTRGRAGGVTGNA